MPVLCEGHRRRTWARGEVKKDYWKEASVYGSGTFRKRGNVIHTWHERRYEIRNDSLLVYYDKKENGVLRGYLKISHIEVQSGKLGHLDKSGFCDFGLEPENGVPMKIISLSEEPHRHLDVVFDFVEDAKKFCILLNKGSNKNNVKEFMTKLNWVDEETQRILDDKVEDSEGHRILHNADPRVAFPTDFQDVGDHIQDSEDEDDASDYVSGSEDEVPTGRSSSSSAPTGVLSSTSSNINAARIKTAGRGVGGVSVSVQDDDNMSTISSLTASSSSSAGGAPRPRAVALSPLQYSDDNAGADADTDGEESLSSSSSAGGPIAVSVPSSSSLSTSTYSEIFQDNGNEAWYDSSPAMAKINYMVGCLECWVSFSFVLSVFAGSIGVGLVDISGSSYFSIGLTQVLLTQIAIYIQKARVAGKGARDRHESVRQLITDTATNTVIVFVTMFVLSLLKNMYTASVAAQATAAATATATAAANSTGVPN